MRLAWLSLLVALTAGAQYGRGGGMTCPPGFRGGGLVPCAPAYAAFEFAPADGKGMGAACACAAPTGVNGEALTLSRASSGACTKGNTTTGIANGDVVLCTTNAPRVMPGGDGTGPLGLLVESTRTNLLIRSEDFNDSAWLTYASGASVIQRDAGVSMAPDGTMTADAIFFPATTGATTTVIYQSPIFMTPTYAAGVFVRGDGESGSINLCLYGGTAYSCVECPYTQEAWSRCTHNTAISLEPGYVTIGNTAMYIGDGGTPRPAAKVFLWGAQAEANGSPTLAPALSSYIPTASAPVARAAETATLPIPGSTGEDFSVAHTVISPWNVTGCNGWISLNSGSTGVAAWQCNTNTAAFRVQSGGQTADSISGLFTAYKWQTGLRVAGTWSRSTGTALAYVDGVAGTPATNANVTSASFAAVQLSPTLMGVFKQLCWDKSLTRCR